MTNLLGVANFTVYRGATPVAGPLALHDAPGEIVVLVGRNGSGKTSLLGGISGLLRATGTAALKGVSLSGAPRDRLLAGLGFCPGGRRLFPDMTVEDNVLLGGYTLPAAVARERASSLRERFALLRERASQRAATLSGGQQQIVALARALMSDPVVLMLDEPTAGLAPLAREQVAEILRTFVARGDRAVVIAEENLEFACALGTRFVALSGGRTVFEIDRAARPDPALIMSRLLEAEVEGASFAGDTHALSR
jgi:branched-chain amino acid transport system ATP-binding protein